MTIDEFIDTYSPGDEVTARILLVDEGNGGRIAFGGTIKQFRKSRRKNFHRANVDHWSILPGIEKVDLIVYVKGMCLKERKE